MKLAFVFNHSHNGEWSSTSGLSASLQKLGHIIDHYDLSNPYEMLEVSNRHAEYNAVCLWEAGSIKDKIVGIWKKENFKNTLMVAEGGDDPQAFRLNLRHTMPADVVITPDADANSEYLRLGKKSYWFTHWGDESVWSYTQPKETGIVATSAGHRPGAWTNVMKVLSQSFGNNFINPRLKNHEYMSAKDNSNLYKNSDVVVQVSANKEITRRLFEASICGRVVVADRLPTSKKLRDCLVENQHIMLYDTPEDCVEKVKYLLANPAKRKEISESAYAHVSRYHSAEARCKYLLQIIEENS